MNLKYLFLALIAVSSLNAAGIEKYFKKAEGKEGNHSMKNIDFLYVINLDKRPEKFALCQEQLNPYGIYPYRFSAVNGWELTLEDINNLGVKFQTGMEEGIMGTSYLPEDGGQPRHGLVKNVGQTYFCHCMSRGAIGINLSHLSVLQDAYDSGYETIWVMEDDIQVIRDPRLISDFVERLDEKIGKKNWDILFTDPDTKNQKGEYVPCLGYAKTPNFQPPNPNAFNVHKNVSHYFTKVGARYGAYSMIVRRSGMKKILNFIKSHKIFLPYDMGFYLHPEISMYSLREDYVSTIPNAISDNGGANYIRNETLN